MSCKQGEWHVQCNCIILITDKKGEDWAKAEIEVKSSYTNLFEIDSSQSQEDPPSPPPQHRKRYSEERHEVDDKDNNSGDYDYVGGRGKQGGGYSGNGGRGKCGY
jgi:hypothetical protein